jgi:integrase
MTLRTQGDRMTEAQRETLVSKWLDAELEYAEDCRATAGRISDLNRAAQLEGLSIMQEEAAEDLTGNDYRRIEKTADELLKAGGLPPLDHDSADFGRLCRRLLQAKYEYTRIESKRWNGQVPSVQRPRVHNGSRGSTAAVSSSPPPTSSAVAAATKPSQGAGPLFTEAVEGFLRENPRAERSMRQLKSELQRFLATIGGDRAVGTISKPDCLKYKDSLLKQDEHGLHLNTVQNGLTTLACIFKWCEGQGYIPEHANPAKGIQLSARSVRKAKRATKMFTDDQLMLIFGSSKFTFIRSEHPAHYWVLLLCLLTACRPDEAAQLHVADILVEDDVPYIRITDEGEGQSVKTADSKRRVPIHDSLLTLGFLKYVKHVKDAGHKRLFYQVSRGRNTYADVASKMFSRMVRALGITDPALYLYSLRHGGITKLHEAGCHPDMVRMLTGHSENDAHGNVYVHREKIRLIVLREGLNKLRYDAVVKALSL